MDKRSEIAIREAVAALEHAKDWINQTCDQAVDQGTSVDTLASGRRAALEPITKALRTLARVMVEA